MVMKQVACACATSCIVLYLYFIVLYSIVFYCIISHILSLLRAVAVAAGPDIDSLRSLCSFRFGDAARSSSSSSILPYYTVVYNSLVPRGLGSIQSLWRVGYETSIQGPYLYLPRYSCI